LRYGLAIGLSAVGLIAMTFLFGWFSAIYPYGSFVDHDRALNIFVTSIGGDTYGLIDIGNGPTELNVILESRQWESLIALWRSARAARNPGWRAIGAVSETEAKNGRLFVLAGNTIRFVIREGQECVSYDIVSGDQGKVESALLRVQDHFAGKISAQPTSISAARAYTATLDAVRYWPPAPPDLPHCGN